MAHGHLALLPADGANIDEESGRVDLLLPSRNDRKML